MTLWARSLASGSSANSLLVQGGSTRLFIDCGTAMRQAIAGMEGAGFPWGRVDALLLTHEHSDHVRGVGALARRLKVPVVGNRPTLEAALWALGPVETQTFVTGCALTIGELRITPFSIPHDAAETVGYLIEYGRWRLCVATDIGHMSAEILYAMRGADLVVLEANHDYEMLRAGPYPAMLKQRILGSRGHLSNVETAAALINVAGEKPQQVWLAHLSAVNNTPDLALRTVRSSLQQAGVSTMTVAVAQRDRPSLTWSSAGVQRPLPL